MGLSVVPENDLPQDAVLVQAGAQNPALFKNRGLTVPENDIPTDYESPIEIAKTALEQGLSGATLGLSKVIETRGVPALGIPSISTPQDIASREEANPGTAMTANIAGSILPAVATAGVGPAIEGAGLAARLAVPTITGAVIGGVNRATDDWSQNKSLDAQKIVASAGLGAVLGLGGSGIIEIAKGATSGAAGAMKWLNGIARGAADGDGIVASLAKGYVNSGEKADNFIGTLSEHLSELYKAGKSAANGMYEQAGQTKLGTALANKSVDEAKAVAGQTIEKINVLVKEGLETEGGLSRTSANLLSRNLQKTAASISEAESALDVHNALSELATDVDKGIKFDTLPTAAQQVDQEVIRGVRSAVRGDLRNSESWGDAAQVYGDLSDNYTGYRSSRKNFERAFMKSRTAPNGQTVKVIDPSKVGAFFKNVSGVNQAERAQTLQEFIESAGKNATYANEFGGYQEGINHLASQVQSIKDFQGKAEVLRLLKNARSDHKTGFGAIALLEAVPMPASIKATLLGLQRYAGKGGAMVMGSDIGSLGKAASSLSDHSESITKRIGSKIQSIVSATAPQEKRLRK